MKALKAGILEWVKKHTDTDGGLGPEVGDIKENFADGTAFLCPARGGGLHGLGLVWPPRLLPLLPGTGVVAGARC